MNQPLKSLVLLVVGIVIGAALALTSVWVYENNIKLRPKELQNAVTAPAFSKILPKFKVLPKIQQKKPLGITNQTVPSLPNYNPAAEGDPLPSTRTN